MDRLQRSPRQKLDSYLKRILCLLRNSDWVDELPVCLGVFGQRVAHEPCGGVGV